MLLAIQETLKLAGSDEKLQRVLVWGYEKQRGVQRSTEKAGATEGIQLAKKIREHTMGGKSAKPFE